MFVFIVEKIVGPTTVTYIIITKCKQHCCEALYNAEPMKNNSDDIFLLASI